MRREEESVTACRIELELRARFPPDRRNGDLIQLSRIKLKPCYPDIFLLDEADPQELTDYLRGMRVIGEDEIVERCEIPGAGNMNLTLRVITQISSYILKQARPWVEKYPKIAAPWDRVLSEAAFYEIARTDPKVSRQMPELLAIDRHAKILVLEDLGEAKDATAIYSGRLLSLSEIRDLGSWLSSLHAITFHRGAPGRLPNREMRRLNHEHIFVFPLRPDNGLDLDGITPGLRSCANRLGAKSDYVENVRRLGEIYLSDGSSLVHGDYFPGSWLRTRDGVSIIDAEFSFFGYGEFDVGVCCAHFCLARQHTEAISPFLESYYAGSGFDLDLMKRFAGAEIMRRLIGVAQLPLPYGLEEKEELLHLTEGLVLEPSRIEFPG